MTAARDETPHSRACGVSLHAHGNDCHSNCPTCHGAEVTSMAETTAGDTLARMVDPHAFDTAKWDARGEPNRLRRVRNAERRADTIIAWVKANPGAIA